MGQSFAAKDPKLTIRPDSISHSNWFPNIDRNICDLGRRKMDCGKNQTVIKYKHLFKHNKPL